MAECPEITGPLTKEQGTNNEEQAIYLTNGLAYQYINMDKINILHLDTECTPPE